MRCCSNRKITQKQREEEVKALAALATPIISTSFVGSPPPSQDSATIIYVWGRKDLLYEDAILEEDFSGSRAEEGHNGTDQPQFSHTLVDTTQFPYRSHDAVTDFSSAPLKTENSSLNASTHQSSRVAAYTQTETLPLILSSLNSVKILHAACGDTHLLLLSSKGEVFSFGVGKSGQLGLGEDIFFAKKPERVDKLDSSIIIQIAAGSSHSIALSDEGTVFAWGDAESVGDACGVNRSMPRQVPSTSTFCERIHLISARFSQSMAVTDSNKLFVWGETFFSHYYTTPHCHQRFPPEETITQISIGRQFALALSRMGRVFAWGDGTYCELGRLQKDDLKGGVATGALAPTEMILVDGSGSLLPNIIAIATGARHSLLLSEDGRVYSFGDNLCGQCGIPLHSVRFDVPRVGDLNRALLIAAHQAVKIQTGDYKLNVRCIAAGLRHSAAITTNDQLVLWGHSAHHKLIHTAPAVTLLEERFGVGVGHMGVSVKSGLKDCCPKPRLIYSLLHQRVSCVCLGDEFTVVVTGNGNSNSNIGVPTSMQALESRKNVGWLRIEEAERDVHQNVL